MWNIFVCIVILTRLGPQFCLLYNLTYFLFAFFLMRSCTTQSFKRIAITISDLFWSIRSWLILKHRPERLTTNRQRIVPDFKIWSWIREVFNLIYTTRVYQDEIKETAYIRLNSNDSLQTHLVITPPFGCWWVSSHTFFNIFLAWLTFLITIYRRHCKMRRRWFRFSVPEEYTCCPRRCHNLLWNIKHRLRNSKFYGGHYFLSGFSRGSDKWVSVWQSILI